MRPEKFVDFLNSPEKLNTATASHFRKLAGQYPYCQPLRFVLAKNLQLLKSTDFEAQVNQAAAMAYDRRMFQSYMAGRLPAKTHDVPVKSAASQSKTSLWPLWLSELFGKKTQASPPGATVPTLAGVVNVPRIITTESSSRLEPQADYAAMTQGVTQSRNKNFDHLISKFIAENPRIGTFNPNIPADNLAEKNQIHPEEIGTETLAAIYERQGFKGKAIAVYEKLSLKYPEKSSYFAQKISSLKNN